MQKTAIIIPCFNEEARLQSDEFHRQLKTFTNLDFIFVNDGSKDKTLDILKKMSEKSSRCHIVDLKKNQGKAAAVYAGFNAAFKTDYQNIGFWDADLATPLNMIPKFCELLDAGKASFVFGARIQRLGAKIQRHALRHYQGRTFATVVSLILKLPIYDTQCGAKIFRNSKQLKQVFSYPFITKWIFDVELIGRLLYVENCAEGKGFAEDTYEYPLEEWNDVAGSKLRMKDLFVALLDLYKIHRSIKRYRKSQLQKSG